MNSGDSTPETTGAHGLKGDADLTLIPIETDREGQELARAAGGLASTDLQPIRKSLDHSVSDNTRAAYASARRSFEAWAGARAALTLPASPQLVAAYLSHLAQERRLAVATVRAALSAMHKAAGHDDPTDNEGVQAGAAGDFQGPRKAPAAGQTPHLRGPGPSEGYGKEQTSPGGTATGGSRPRGRPGGPGWTSPCCRCSATGCSAAQRPRPSPGATWSSRTAAPSSSRSAAPRPTPRLRAWYSTSARVPQVH